MRNWLLPCLTLVLVTTAAVRPATAEDASVTTYRLLREELRLARENQIYFVFDLPSRSVSFRGNGLSVAEFPVFAWHSWGQPEEKPHIAVLTAKDSLSTPERTRIQVLPPGQTPVLSAENDLQALEIDDMPVRYQLLLNDGTVIRVSPVPGGFFARVVDGLRRVGWYLSRPLISDWKLCRGKPYTELALVLQPRDARLLYWSFTAGGRCLIHWPPR